MKDNMLEALEKSKEIDKIKDTKNKGQIMSIVSIISSIYGIYFWSSLFLPVGLLLSFLGITMSSKVKNKLGTILGIIGFILAIIGLYQNSIWLTKWN